MIEEARIKHFNDSRKTSGDYVLYWMQASQRAKYNHALEFAVEKANELRQPLIVYFGLTINYPEANLRHYRFMLEGIQETKLALSHRGINMIIRVESPEIGALNMSANASLLVCDCGYLRIQRKWRQYVVDRAACPVFQVEGEVIVPVEAVSTKEEYSAATFRPKILKQLPTYMVKLAQNRCRINSLNLEFEGIDVSKALVGLDIDRSVPPVKGFKGGIKEAEMRLKVFVKDKLSAYKDKKNDPNADVLSNLSPYLHFGQISPLEIALKVANTGIPDADTFLEELIVRRELSMNYCFYNSTYDTFEGLPAWAKRTLKEHGSDNRQYSYSFEEFETASTHDEYWNAAQTEMVITGKMHGYMRMYWGKKILEWSASPEEAYNTAVYLNNKYELDGRDPNGFTGIAWCFGKHDRPWGTRPVLGNIRFMSAEGLRRKFDVATYVSKNSRSSGRATQNENQT
jgi:deoxyribodipyrimidine photo-lyase